MEVSLDEVVPAKLSEDVAPLDATGVGEADGLLQLGVVVLGLVFHRLLLAQR